GCAYNRSVRPLVGGGGSLRGELCTGCSIGPVSGPFLSGASCRSIRPCTGSSFALAFEISVGRVCPRRGIGVPENLLTVASAPFYDGAKSHSSLRVGAHERHLSFHQRQARPRPVGVFWRARRRCVQSGDRREAAA